VRKARGRGRGGGGGGTGLGGGRQGTFLQKTTHYFLSATRQYFSNKYIKMLCMQQTNKLAISECFIKRR